MGGGSIAANNKNFKINYARSLFVFLILIYFSFALPAQDSPLIQKNESFALAQVYMNLSLTEKYFDSLSTSRISKIIPYEENVLESFENKKFIRQNANLYNFSYSLLNFNKAKLLFRDRREVNRDKLVEWKNELGLANRYYKRALEKPMFTRLDTSFYDLINFNQDSEKSLYWGIENFRAKFTPYFNNDIYPEYQKLFFSAKRANNFNFLALWSSAAIYDLSLEFSILNAMGEKITNYLKPSGDIIYTLDRKLDLISRYIQLKYIASDQFNKTLTEFQIRELYDSYDSFNKDLKGEKDRFIIQELNTAVSKTLYNELQKKYPHEKVQIAYSINNPSPSGVEAMEYIKIDQYFFPDPAPLASANITVENYQPSSTVLGDVDTHISGILRTAGYRNQLHYYYDLDGFALATSLEKFNTNGSTIAEDERWITHLGSEGKFSYYEIFKSLFFEIESEFRMFVFIVASKNVTFSTEPPSPGDVEFLIQHSYETLPKDLKEKSLPNKNLTVIVYYFHQNDIGQVPELELSGTLSALDHLNLAEINNLIRND
ncbi:hypothetical protein GCM10007383_22280 [Arenibacter certesii]|uniref:Uncharacterized protein n=2 Tax=Arenibacter certesii TaxID=228955 RepID=A0A918MMP2_9FLAO|nr:hypothetical protein GCM10007383_22280 [Arenibacter certesii]